VEWRASEGRAGLQTCNSKLRKKERKSKNKTKQKERKNEREPFHSSGRLGEGAGLNCA